MIDQWIWKTVLIVVVSVIGNAQVQAEINLSALPQLKALKINNTQVITSGLPTSPQLEQIQQAGIDVIINLIPNNHPSANPDEAKIATHAGLEYVNVEVDWQTPTIANVEQFVTAMRTHQHQDILIHCIANYRASAFYYLYQVTQEKLDQHAAAKVTLTPWGVDASQRFNEYPQWLELINKYIEKHQ